MFGEYAPLLLTIKPGFVDTPTTAHLNNKGILFSKPERIAKDTIKAMKKQKSVLYTPWYWFWIMLVIKMIPEKLFRRLKKL